MAPSGPGCRRLPGSRDQRLRSGPSRERAPRRPAVQGEDHTSGDRARRGAERGAGSPGFRRSLWSPPTLDAFAPFVSGVGAGGRGTFPCKSLPRPSGRVAPGRAKAAGPPDAHRVRVRVRPRAGLGGRAAGESGELAGTPGTAPAPAAPAEEGEGAAGGHSPSAGPARPVREAAAQAAAAATRARV